MSNQQWHESPMTKIQSLASTIAIMVAALFYVAGIERDVAVLEANQATMQRQILEYQEDNKEMFDEKGIVIVPPTRKVSQIVSHRAPSFIAFRGSGSQLWSLRAPCFSFQALVLKIIFCSKCE